MINKYSLKSIADSIHPKWLMDEKAKIFRKEIWFNPPKAPIQAEKIITK